MCCAEFSSAAAAAPVAAAAPHVLGPPAGPDEDALALVAMGRGTLKLGSPALLAAARASAAETGARAGMMVLACWLDGGESRAAEPAGGQAHCLALERHTACIPCGRRS